MKKFAMALCMVLAFTLLFGTAMAENTATSAIYIGESAAITPVTLRIATLDGEILFDSPVTVVDDTPTAYMALTAAAEAAGLTLDVSGDTLNMLFLNGINDLVSENPAFWMFYINQSMAAMGMGTQSIVAGDVIEFLYGDYSIGYVTVTAR